MILVAISSPVSYPPRFPEKRTLTPQKPAPKDFTQGVPDDATRLPWHSVPIGTFGSWLLVRHTQI